MIGSLGDVIFEVSDKKVFSINNQINRSYKSKISEHNPIYGPGMLRHQGRELTEITFGITLISSLLQETTPSEQLDKIKTMWEFGEYGYLTLGGQTFGAFPFLIIDMSEKNSYFNKETSEFDYINLDLTLKEYIDDPKKYNQIIEQLKAQKKEQEKLMETEAVNVEAEQKTKLQEFAEKVKSKVDSTLEKVDKAIQIAENKKKEILEQLEKIKKDAKIDELMNLVRAGMITADKVNEMIDYAKNFSETDRQILLNFLRNQIGGK
ncbi:phage tail protein [Leptotrichia massiliensis]|uniref:phage tail protein n=1 Tax=Leptotrichia massiliensis TaxID=1852388 RepID=UPI0028D5CBDC|nr:phage tail protein [Leptotrichia massiliensis]